MRSKENYIFKGKLTGTFSTSQKINLAAGDKLPKDEANKIVIHRGIVTDANIIEEDSYEEIKAVCIFNDVKNIQVNTNKGWPEKKDRIYFLQNIKATNLIISKVQVINEKTYGELSADIVATIPLKSLSDNTSQEEETPDSNNNSFINGGNNTGTENNNNDKYFPGNGDQGNHQKPWITDGCLVKFWKWLKWLLIILFLIWFLYAFTQFGQKITCYYRLWNSEREFLNIKEDADSLQSKLERIKPVVQPCQSIAFDGDNQPRSFTYNLGKKSGWVIISYDMRTIPDRMEVYYNGELAGETKDELGFLDVGNGQIIDFSKLKGFATKLGAIRFYYEYNKNSPTEILVRIIPNQQYTSTKWNFDMKCP
jgi:hypothetical protein